MVRDGDPLVEEGGGACRPPPWSERGHIRGCPSTRSCGSGSCPLRQSRCPGADLATQASARCAGDAERWGPSQKDVV